MSLAVGTRLGSHEIVGLLGAGGMGEVYRAHDTKLNRQVAIKVLPEPYSADAKTEEVVVNASPVTSFSIAAKTTPQVPDVSRRAVDAMPDGEHVVGTSNGTGTGGAGLPAAQIDVVLNWFDELKAKVPIK